MNEAERLGQRLQELRQIKGLSQVQLADAAGVPIGSLRNWEQGLRVPLLSAAYRLARALGITLDGLAGRIFEEPSGGAADKPSGVAPEATSGGKGARAPTGQKRPVAGRTAKRKGI